MKSESVQSQQIVHVQWHPFHDGQGLLDFVLRFFRPTTFMRVSVLSFKVDTGC